jgi:hypothetical protein
MPDNARLAPPQALQGPPMKDRKTTGRRIA